ncbi:glycine cleavage system protein GcvH [Sporolactobacillus spathodeae]|uniref:Glycine cleavage system H protein n=1 Tax=Sporolactobacillus spathodeae TaxID=1465502 RepID=A0ABS2Q492_9BACL|nr:glycine cleavage system protein GcvH [Sporolactobacillus spathodeae]MBM7656597.1 glycine cleavage system H protein [Sporolactobacillus spathodeae]
MGVPEELFYSKDHEWVKKTEEGKVQIGITAFAQKELGDIVFVELPEIGETLEAGDSFGSVESVKTVSELYAPVAGTVSATNTDLEDSPELVNESPYDQAWMIELEADQFDFSDLLTAEAYNQMIGENA